MTVSARLSVFSDPIKDFPLTLGNFVPGLHWSVLCCPLEESPLQGSPAYLQHLSPPWEFVLCTLAPLASRNLCPELSKVLWANFQFAPGASLGNSPCNKLEPLFPISQGSLPVFLHLMPIPCKVPTGLSPACFWTIILNFYKFWVTSKNLNLKSLGV